MSWEKGEKGVRWTEIESNEEKTEKERETQSKK